MTRNTWSVPDTEVVDQIEQRLDGESADVLATIVRVEGNAYRRPGAKSLLSTDGTGVGSITAGCLEDDLLRTAESVRETGRPELVTYDLMEDEEDVWGLGVGCNGIIDVLLEPLSETFRPAIEAFDDGRDVAICTVLATDSDSALSLGDRAYYHPDDDRLATPTDEPASTWPASNLVGPAAELTTRGNASVIDVEHEESTISIFVDGLTPPDELVIFGSGHDVGPVTDLAAKNGFRVTVVGFRGAVDLSDRFPDADRTLQTSPARVAEAVDLGARTYAVVMTHNFLDDRLTIETLLDADIPYVGLMGPSERFEEMLEAFEADGRPVDAEDLDTLYTPVGLDLGDGSPYGIAHSIVAEVVAVANDRTPGHLRDRAGHIHERVNILASDETGSS